MLTEKQVLNTLADVERLLLEAQRTKKEKKETPASEYEKTLKNSYIRSINKLLVEITQD